MSSQERMTACENVCRDFFWLTPVTELLQHIAVIIGVILAWQQLISWRSQRIAAKRADLGEELLASVYDLELKISYVRSSFGYGPTSGEPDDGTFDFTRRLKEIADLNDDFKNLRRLMFRQRFLFENEDIGRDIDVFFEVRAKLIVALRGQIREIKKLPTHSNASSTERQTKREAIIWEGFDDEQPDEIADKIKLAKASIERTMLPYIRLGIAS